jgi:hypothetical protein
VVRLGERHRAHVVLDRRRHAEGALERVRDRDVPPAQRERHDAAPAGRVHRPGHAHADPAQPGAGPVDQGRGRRHRGIQGFDGGTRRAQRHLHHLGYLAGQVAQSDLDPVDAHVDADRHGRVPDEGHLRRLGAAQVGPPGRQRLDHVALAEQFGHDRRHRRDGQSGAPRQFPPRQWPVLVDQTKEQTPVVRTHVLWQQASSFHPESSPGRRCLHDSDRW